MNKITNNYNVLKVKSGKFLKLSIKPVLDPSRMTHILIKLCITDICFAIFCYFLIISDFGVKKKKILNMSLSSGALTYVNKESSSCNDCETKCLLYKA